MLLRRPSHCLRSSGLLARRTRRLLIATSSPLPLQRPRSKAGRHRQSRCSLHEYAATKDRFRLSRPARTRLHPRASSNRFTSSRRGGLTYFDMSRVFAGASETDIKATRIVSSRAVMPTAARRGIHTDSLENFALTSRVTRCKWMRRADRLRTYGRRSSAHTRLTIRR